MKNVLVIIYIAHTFLSLFFRSWQLSGLEKSAGQRMKTEMALGVYCVVTAAGQVLSVGNDQTLLLLFLLNVPDHLPLLKTLFHPID